VHNPIHTQPIPHCLDHCALVKQMAGILFTPFITQATYGIRQRDCTPHLQIELRRQSVMDQTPRTSYCFERSACSPHVHEQFSFEGCLINWMECFLDKLVDVSSDIAIWFWVPPSPNVSRFSFRNEPVQNRIKFVKNPNSLSNIALLHSMFHFHTSSTQAPDFLILPIPAHFSFWGVQSIYACSINGKIYYTLFVSFNLYVCILHGN